MTAAAFCDRMIEKTAKRMKSKTEMTEQKIKRPELLSPAGDSEKLAAAVRYGADAVYLSGEAFGMRAASRNFTIPEIYSAAELLHSLGKRLYITVNVLPHSSEYPALREFLQAVRGAAPDAFIVADLGVMALVREIVPEADIHISTQTSITSPAAALAYAAMGASRLVLARELTLGEIGEIRAALPPEVEIECFVHGSMCVSYSGRCLLSNAMVGRNANHGQCAQPCRWNYTLMEEKRTDERYPIEETAAGTFIMSSRDICMIEHIPELIKAGVASFKLEGRVKSAYYAAVVTNAYRMAIDAYLADPEGYSFDPRWLDELCSVSHREYDTGFYYDTPMRDPKLCANLGYIREKAYLAIAPTIDRDPEADSPLPSGLEELTVGGRLYRFTQRNKLSVGDRAELLTPGRPGLPFDVREMYDAEGTPIDSAPHPSMTFYLRVPFDVTPGDIIRAGM